MRLALVLCLIAGGATAQQASLSAGAELRVLDKLTGETADLTLRAGETIRAGLLTVALSECRVPVNNPSGDAYARIMVQYQNDAAPAFSGWMIASAPALNAMDHPRYDVWVLRCTT